MGQNETSVTGAMIYTDEPTPNGQRFRFLWPLVPAENLVTPATEGGLLDPSTWQFCQDHRARYQSDLIARAKAKGQIQDLEYQPETGTGRNVTVTTSHQNLLAQNFQFKPTSLPPKTPKFRQVHLPNESLLAHFPALTQSPRPL